MIEIETISYSGIMSKQKFDNMPNECPFCHKCITPRKHQAFEMNDFAEIVFSCPNSDCRRVFTSLYKRKTVEYRPCYIYESTSIGLCKEKAFTENIKKISKSFIEIFNQASQSDSLKLNHIAGIGYRKALEFLIKDYLIFKDPEKSEDIKKKSLGKCITNDIDYIKLKDIAERANWLGNDEAHYLRQWKDKDINDLKILIELLLHWIEIEILTDQYKLGMEKQFNSKSIEQTIKK